MFSETKTVVMNELISLEMRLSISHKKVGAVLFYLL